jgi:hypothetical protein
MVSDYQALQKFDVLHIDWVGPLLPPSREGYTYIFTVVDAWSGYPWAFPAKNKSAPIAVNLLVNNIFSQTQYPGNQQDRDNSITSAS